MGDNNKNLKIMIKIYAPGDVDWMGFALSRRNPFTFHHIVPRSAGGLDIVENGAILTRRAHDLLHILEYACPDAYQDLNNLFKIINASSMPLIEELKEEIDFIMCRIFMKEYDFVIDVDLSMYYEMYYHHKKKDKVLKK